MDVHKLYRCINWTQDGMQDMIRKNQHYHWQFSYLFSKYIHTQSSDQYRTMNQDHDDQDINSNTPTTYNNYRSSQYINSNNPYCRSQHSLYTYNSNRYSKNTYLTLENWKKKKCFNQNNFCESTQVTQWICPHKDHDIFPQVDKERKGLKYTVKERRILNMWRKQIWKDNELDNTVKESLTEERLIQSRKV